VERVRIDDAAAVEAARAYCRRAMPEADGKIEYAPPPLFDEALEEEIDRLSEPRVTLPSGGWITIETTEALTAIDVNSGTFTQSSGLAETSLTTDREAAREIGRQLRLRGIGGLIVIDFIHLQDSAHAAQVLAALAESLAFDRAPVRISPMSEFGLVAVTRKRIREPLARLTSQACAACDGAGRQATPEALALALLRRVEREARANPGRALVARAAPAVVDWLAARDEDVRRDLLRRGAARVRFEAAAMGDAFDVHAV
jgi:ribonuclease G